MATPSSSKPFAQHKALASLLLFAIATSPGCSLSRTRHDVLITSPKSHEVVELQVWVASDWFLGGSWYSSIWPSLFDAEMRGQPEREE